MVAQTSRSRAATWAVSGLLAVLYLFAGGTKLAGIPLHVEHFAQWGYPDWFRLVVGAWEALFGVLLLVPALAWYAAGALALDMLGAVYTEAFRGDPPRALVPLVLLAMLLVLARVRAPGRWRPGGRP
jgi:uncharacterized membrane protein YphA (DoxX/SURF4 family)